MRPRDVLGGYLETLRPYLSVQVSICITDLG